MSLYRTTAKTPAGLVFCCGGLLGAHYSFIHYGPNEGLNAAVREIVQDGLGFIWVGTSNGLFRYDGEHFQQFGRSEGLANSSIRCLHKSRDGSIWAITGQGLV